MTNNQKNSESNNLACVILAAGLGTRMRSSKSKVMHEVAGFPMINHVIKACEAIDPEKIIVVGAPDMPDLAQAIKPHTLALQEKQLGTGDAVKAAIPALEGFDGDVLVVFGDTPLIRSSALSDMVGFKEVTKVHLAVSGFIPEISGKYKYGRLIIDDDHFLKAIVEDADATDEQREIDFCNGGIMLFDVEILRTLLVELQSDNAQNEYYLTDCVELANDKGLTVAAAHLHEDDVRGVNTRTQLAEVDGIMQRRLSEAHMLRGVTMHDPKSVYLCADTQLGQDVVIEPNVVFGRGVKVADGAQIRAFSHLEEATVGAKAEIGPYARLRPNTKIGESAKIGNFVEIKKATIANGAKVNHLSYIGDAEVGAKSNIGAGTITCNYDGYSKSKTVIGAGTFIGSNTILIAPVEVGDGAITAAGSVLTKNVASDALAVARVPQKSYDGWAASFRSKKEK